MTNMITAVKATLEEFSTLGATLPGRRRTRSRLLCPPARAGLRAGLGTGGAGARMATQWTRVYSTGQKFAAHGVACPGGRRAALYGGGGLAAMARCLHRLWTRRTCSYTL